MLKSNHPNERFKNISAMQGPSAGDVRVAFIGRDVIESSGLDASTVFFCLSPLILVMPLSLLSQELISDITVPCS